MAELIYRESAALNVAIGLIAWVVAGRSSPVEGGALSLVCVADSLLDLVMNHRISDV
jgi:hypothetical protein